MNDLYKQFLTLLTKIGGGGLFSFPTCALGWLRRAVLGQVLRETRRGGRSIWESVGRTQEGSGVWVGRQGRTEAWLSPARTGRASPSPTRIPGVDLCVGRDEVRVHLMAQLESPLGCWVGTAGPWGDSRVGQLTMVTTVTMGTCSHALPRNFGHPAPTDSGRLATAPHLGLP